jgi:hypothetical protein
MTQIPFIAFHINPSQIDSRAPDIYLTALLQVDVI